jgi:hypothetical protein
MSDQATRRRVRLVRDLYESVLIGRDEGWEDEEIARAGVELAEGVRDLARLGYLDAETEVMIG